MANGTIHKLGTLYVNNVKRPFPTKPWSSDSIPSGAPSVGNILNYDSVNNNIEIRDTYADDAYKLRWIEVNDGNKKLLISDRVLLTRVTWDELNTQELISGKEITIDGQKYKIRLLSGGTSYRSSSNGYDGGYPTTNEWDRIITNESSLSGLPKPTSTDLDTALNSTDYNGEHNNIWHWHGIFSFCQEVYSQNSSARVIRGHYSPRFLNYINSSTRYSYYGWRPVLEVLTAPTINGADGNLGDYASPLVKQYSISDSDNDKLSVTEKLDGVTIKSLTNQNSGASITLDLTSIWGDISYGNHTIEIIVTDSNELSSTATITFNKIKPPIQTIPTISSLKQAIDHSKEIDKEIEYLLIKLRNNLIDKGVEVLDTYNISSLIGRISDIKTVIKTIAGDDLIIFDFKHELSSMSNENVEIQYMKYHFYNEGSVRLSIKAKGGSSSYKPTIYFKLYNKTGGIKSTKTFYSSQLSTNYTELTYDFSNIELSDYLVVSYSSSSSAASTYLRDFKISIKEVK